MPDEMVSLEAAGTRARELLQGLENSFVPLAVAAAITFHQAQGSTKAIVTRQDYDDALNIAAAALSCLIPVYELADSKIGRVPVAIDLTCQRFARGATEVRVKDQPVARNLSIRFTDLQAAVALIKTAGLPFSFALSSGIAPLAEPTPQGKPFKQV